MEKIKQLADVPKLSKAFHGKWSNWFIDQSKLSITFDPRKRVVNEEAFDFRIYCLLNERVTRVMLSSFRLERKIPRYTISL